MNVRESAVSAGEVVAGKKLILIFFIYLAYIRTKNKGIWLIVFILTNFKMHWDLWH